MSKEWLILAVGTNNWQGPGQFAPGSGILHHGHHIALNSLPNTHCYSLWPSDIQKTPKDRDDYRVYEISHPIPICESVGPQSSKRWHSMSEEESKAYCDNLFKAAWDYIEYVEKKHGCPLDLCFAHHCFMNPVILSRINKTRVEKGKTKIPVVTFAHGTALKMFENELANLPEFPMKYYNWMREEEKVFEGANEIAGVFAISLAQKSTFERLFPDYPKERVVVTPNGYNQLIFNVDSGVSRQDAIESLPQVLYDGFAGEGLDESMKQVIAPGETVPNIDSFEKVIVFCGRFADWKRLDTVLSAASKWEKLGYNYLTIIVGGGSQEARKTYVDLAYKDLKLEKTFFVGPLGQPEIAKVFNVADVGVFPSKEEPFGLVFVECMGCGTPVIGAKSGGPIDFIDDDVGALVDEGTNELVSEGVYSTVLKAMKEDWKTTKGPVCQEYALKKFSLVTQATTMLQVVESHFL